MLGSFGGSSLQNVITMTGARHCVVIIAEH
jgi:hypothetical protein